MGKGDNELLKELRAGPMLVASLDGDDLPFLLEEAKTQRADIVELRMDLWSNFFREGMQDKMSRFKQKIGIPMLVSFRGGHPFPPWWQPLHWSALASAALVDVEWNPKYPWKDIRRYTAQYGLGLVISHHDYESTPPAAKLRTIVQSALRQGATLVKVAAKVKSENDVRSLLELSVEFSRKTLITVMGMGAMGAVSRLAAPLFGSRLIYGYIGTPTAVGQSPYKELQERTRLYFPAYNAAFVERQKKRANPI